MKHVDICIDTVVIFLIQNVDLSDVELILVLKTV